MNQTLEADRRDLSARTMLSAFSGLAVLCILVAVLAASTFIASQQGPQTPHLYTAGTSQGDPSPVPSITFYLFDSDAQLEDSREIIELAEDQVAQIPLPSYPRVVTLVAHTPDEEAFAYARIVEQVRSSNGEPLRIEVIDLRRDASSSSKALVADGAIVLEA